MPSALEKRVVVVGAGVVGLSVGRALAARGFQDILLLESQSTFGQSTSSRNSGVLHAGIYYPYNSWKRRFCIPGHRKMLNFCRQHRVNHEIVGKLIVDDRLPGSGGGEGSENPLQGIYDQGTANGAKLEMLSDKKTIRCLEPNLADHISSAIYSPLTGIVDTHDYMFHLQHLGEEGGLQIAWECSIDGEQATGKNTLVSGRWDSGVEDKIPGVDLPGDSSSSLEDQTISVLETNQGPLDDVGFVVNCAGLSACEIARKLGVKDVPRARYAQGNYWKAEFGAGNAVKKHPKTDIELAKEHLTAEECSTDEEGTQKRRLFNHLIYPLPEVGGLGTHLTLDLDGSIRFGPNVIWCDESKEGFERLPSGTMTSEEEAQWYETQPPNEKIYSSIRRYFPALPDLVPDYAGLRPKLEGTTDFCFVETHNSINCLGIESPGLTSSLAIGEAVADRVHQRLMEMS